MTPFLKGIHLTLDSWRHDRLRSGWKSSTSNTKAESNYAMEEWSHYVDEDCLSSEDTWILPSPFSDRNQQSSTTNCASNDNDSPPLPPNTVIAVPRLIDDLQALNSFLDHELLST